MTDWISAVIVDDNDENIIIPVSSLKKEKVKKEKVKKEKVKKVVTKKDEVTDDTNTKEIKVTPTCLLTKFHNPDLSIIEVGADEAGRGPMFGRVYSGAVVLPKDDSFDHYKMKDSKKFTSKNSKKIQEVAEYIKANAIAWAVEYEDEGVIDDINILQATQSAMHKAIRNVMKQIKDLDPTNLFLLIDGNYFKPLTIFNKQTNRIENAKFETIEGGDNKFTAIAAASILAKVERDKYIEELCLENPELIEKYGIDSNKGYGSKTHMDGIRKYGITKWHRRTFGLCKEYC
jgi:ribonuclease HII